MVDKSCKFGVRQNVNLDEKGREGERGERGRERREREREREREFKINCPLLN